jgi:pimeloyl-ACP methyl ester carboxylesterase
MTTTQPATSGLIDAGTTKLYHEVRGDGPTLLLITGGSGDADEWGRVAPALAKDFTVVTYDRRGSSRSPRPAGWAATTVEEQGDDAAGLLRALDLAPAVVVGHSGGASIACALVARHPEVVQHAVAYEPPLLAILPNREEIVGGFQTMVEQAMAEGGPRRAMEVFIRANADDETYDAWFRATAPALRERVFTNAETFFSIELPAFAAFVPDRDRLRESGVPMTVIVGQDNRDNWYGDAAHWLVEGSDADLVELPGGHGGFETHKEDFVKLVRRIGLGAFADAATQVRS